MRCEASDMPRSAEDRAGTMCITKRHRPGGAPSRAAGVALDECSNSSRSAPEHLCAGRRHSAAPRDG
jgi:hypothetical protein